ncbi:SRPBCC domain-containing protein [bacterium]|nr:SRPBCC domain-containing protein [candidate division CSSED10-310 bacterium]
MVKMQFEVSIRANSKNVWDAVVDDKKFREWTRVFNENSHFEGGWEKGAKIRFLGTSEKGEKEGMVSEIAESRRYSFISIRHLGYVYGDREDTTSETVREWAPAYENYTLTESGNQTKFEVDVDTEERFVEMFKDMWPKALQKLKEIAER